MSQIFDIVSIGSAVRDIVFYTPETQVIDNPEHDPTRLRLMCVEYGAKLKSDDVHFLYGGGAMNTAINMHGLGLRNGVITCVGSDGEGDEIVQRMEEQGIDVSGVQRAEQRTGFSFLLVNKTTGERTVHVYYGAVNDLQVTPELLEKTPAQWYYVSSLSGDFWNESLEAIAATNAQVAWNPGGTQLKAGYDGLKTMIAHTTLLLLNKDEAVELVLSHPEVSEPPATDEALLELLHSWGPEAVVVTDGKAGSWGYTNGKHTYHPTPDDHPTDTTGAGDCYGSTLTAAYIRYEGDMDTAMDIAAANATSLVHSVGAQQGFLTWEELTAK